MGAVTGDQRGRTMVAMATARPARLAPIAHPATPGPPAVASTQLALAVARARTSSQAVLLTVPWTVMVPAPSVRVAVKTSSRRAGLVLRIGGLVGVRMVRPPCRQGRLALDVLGGGVGPGGAEEHRDVDRLDGEAAADVVPQARGR